MDYRVPPAIKSQRILIVQPNQCSLSETFLRAHANLLPADITVACGAHAYVDGKPIRSDAKIVRAFRRARRMVSGQTWDDEITSGYSHLLRRLRPHAVLAEYGEMGVMMTDACRRAGIPLVVHFHGYDASIRSVLEELKDDYRRMFATTAAVVAVSRAMARKLVHLGAAPERVHWCPYGVETNAFQGAEPAGVPPLFLAVGRFTPKKAPQLTIRAFADVHRALPEARLRMIGYGPLEDECKSLARELGLNDAVNFLGPCAPEVVQAEMRKARCFVQHSIEAPDGDSEGTPVSILEACASGLPVVSTRHAGIPDVVQEGETGFLVDEHDVPAMAVHMQLLARDGALAARLGRAGQLRVRREFNIERRITSLWHIIESAIDSNASDRARPTVKVSAATVGMFESIIP